MEEKRIAVLKSSHQEVSRVGADKIGFVWHQDNAPDLLTVVLDNGARIYCDEIEFTTENE